MATKTPPPTPSSGSSTPPSPSSSESASLSTSPPPLNLTWWEELFNFFRKGSHSPGHHPPEHKIRDAVQSIFEKDPDRLSPPQKIMSNNNPENEPKRIEIQRKFNPSKWTKKKLTSSQETLLERTLNVNHLSILDNQKFVILPSDELYLPALKIFSWHASYPSYPPSPFEHEWDFTEDHHYDDHHQLPMKVKQLLHLQDQQQEKVMDKSNLTKRHAIYRILLSAPNLCRIEDFNFDRDFDLVLASGKIHTIRQLCISDLVDVPNLREFIEARPRLSVLQLMDTGQGFVQLDFEGREKLATTLRLLFLTTFDCLRVLDLSQFCTYIGLQIVHPLPNLHQLVLGSLADPLRPSRVLPLHINLSGTFPHLNVLDVSRFQCDEEWYWDLYFPPAFHYTGSLSTVRVLVVSDTMTHFFMEKMRKELCPNFVKLIVDSKGHDHSLEFMMIKVFRYWPFLEGLELKIWDFPGEDLCLDSILTGLNEDTCEGLREKGPLPGQECDETVEEIQAGQASVAKLKNLKTLDITLGHACLSRLALQPDQKEEEDDDIEIERFRPLISFVSGRYGLSHIPGLKVNLSFDRQCPWGKEIIDKICSLIVGLDITLIHRPGGHCRCRRPSTAA